MKSKTQFTSLERRISKGKWRWAVFILGEYIDGGIADSQGDARKKKAATKEAYLARNKNTSMLDMQKVGALPLPKDVPNPKSLFFAANRSKFLRVWRDAPPPDVHTLIPALRPESENFLV